MLGTAISRGISPFIKLLGPSFRKISKNIVEQLRYGASEKMIKWKGDIANIIPYMYTDKKQNLTKLLSLPNLAPCILVFTTSWGQPMAAARQPGTKPSVMRSTTFRSVFPVLVLYCSKNISLVVNRVMLNRMSLYSVAVHPLESPLSPWSFMTCMTPCFLTCARTMILSEGQPVYIKEY